MAHHFLRFAHTKGSSVPNDAEDMKKGGVSFTACTAGAGSKKPESVHAQINDSHGDNQGHIKRKGTGFVNMDELPPSDDEDEDDEDDDRPKPAANGHVQIQDAH